MRLNCQLTGSNLQPNNTWQWPEGARLFLRQLVNLNAPERTGLLLCVLLLLGQTLVLCSLLLLHLKVRTDSSKERKASASSYLLQETK